MTEVVMDAEQQADPVEGTGKCPQPGCLRGFPHEGVRHRYAPTKDLQPEPEPEPVEIPVADERPFAGELSSQPRNHAFTVIDRSKGLYVAWDTCAGCQHHITRCFCPNGPKTPEYIERWRQQQFPLAQPTRGEAKQIARDVAVDLGIRTESQRFEPGPLDGLNVIDEDHVRVATHICDACGLPLYLLDSPLGKRAFTVEGDNNYCTVEDSGIHVAREITQDDRDSNPQWFGGDDLDDDEDLPDTDDEDQVEAATDSEMAALVADEVDQTPVQTDTAPSSNIDPEVGF